MISGTRRLAGFTLIEILIVAALITLLAGIAVINIQAAYVANQRKAALGEARQIATALSFAYEDIGIYPKFCFLPQNVFFVAPNQAAPNAQPGSLLVDGFEYMGYDVNRPLTLTNRIIKNWAKGTTSNGYFSAGQGRRGLFQGRRGGLTRMRISIGQNPIIPVEQDSLPPEQRAIYDWPADPWGRPYVLYLLRLEKGLQTSNGLPRVRFVNGATEAANYALAVVSYGPNNMPGGPEDYAYDTPTMTIVQRRCLYIKIQDPWADCLALTPTQYNEIGQNPDVPFRAQAWSYVKLGPDPEMPAGHPGIIDAGSDDLIIDF